MTSLSLFSLYWRNPDRESCFEEQEEVATEEFQEKEDNKNGEEEEEEAEETPKLVQHWSRAEQR